MALLGGRRDFVQLTGLDFLGSSPFLRNPDYEVGFPGFPWIPRPNLDLSIGYKRFSREDFSSHFVVAKAPSKRRPQDSACGRDRLFIGKFSVISDFLQEIAARSTSLDLRTLIGATDGNLGAHLDHLARAGYVQVTKALSAEGLAPVQACAWARGVGPHVAFLKSIIEGA